jgi:Ca2+-binding RTX toxin-like protein
MRLGRVVAMVGTVSIVGWSVALVTGPPAVSSAPRAVVCDGRAATVVGTVGADVLRGTRGPDVIAALGGNDTLIGLRGDDRLCGGLGRDRLIGGPGNDRLLGGADWLHVTDEGSTERVGDQLSGDAGNDVLLPGRDRRAADDVIHDEISWESSPHRVTVNAATGVSLGQGRDRFDSRGAWLTGSRYADDIRGSAGRDLLSSGRGDDVVRGLGGADRILTDPFGSNGGDDLALGGLGNDMISADRGEDVLRGGPGDDVVDDMGPAADRLYGGPGADRLFTQITDVSGVDQVVDGGAGAHDLVDLHTQTINPTTEPASAVWSMTTGKLTYTLDHPVSLTVAHVERVDLSAWGTSWAITGTNGPDRLSASGSWGTVFRGLAGDDTFLGSSYDDVFRGGAGTDHSLGMGAGTDTCLSVEVLDETDCENTSP